MPEIIAEVEETIEVTATVAATPGSLTDDYNDLQNHPSINGVELVGNKTTGDLGIEPLPGSITPEMFAPDTQEDMVVGLAKNLLANSGVTSSSPYLFRKSPQNVSAELHRLVGGTVAWNQLVPTASKTFTSTPTGAYTYDTHNVTFSVLANHVYVVGLMVKNYSGGKTLRAFVQSGNIYGRPTQDLTGTTGRFAWIIKAPGASTYMTVGLSNVATSDKMTSADAWTADYVMVIDVTALLGATVAQAIYDIDLATAGAGLSLFKQYFPSAYYPYSAPTLASVQTSARVARGFNQWDEEWRNGTYSNSTGAYTASSNYFANANPIPVIPGEQYNLRIGDNSTMRFLFYGENGAYLSYTDKTASDSVFTVPTGAVWMNFCGTTTNYGTVYKHDICINLSDSNRNGQYESYKSKSYLIDDVVLRGIPKLTNGQLVYDGDIYLPSGEVTRKYAEVDLGSLTWTYNSTNAYFYASMPTDSATVVAGGVNGVCGKYLCTTITSADFYASDKVLTYCNANMSSSKRVFIRDTAYTDATAFKTAVTGSKLVYILATPTTEQADPYTEVQLAGTTEQFVCDNYIPVGNESFYPTDLTGVVQNLAPLPTTAGTYKLQVTVSGGVPSYSWVAG